MDAKTARLVQEMIRYEEGCAARVHHFLKVFALAQTIGTAERLDPHTQFVLETAALTHDIGIRPSLVRYGQSAGCYQQQEGPPAARALLLRLGYEEQVIARVRPDRVAPHLRTGRGARLQILIEADLLVNIQEENLRKDAIYIWHSAISAPRRGSCCYSTSICAEPMGDKGGGCRETLLFLGSPYLSFK
ncbi:MAG: phosphohydrolase [Oscillospiraceae bacterium]